MLRTFAVLLVAAGLLAPAAVAQAADDPEPVDRETTLADLTYASGAHAVFSIDESGDLGLRQEGLVDRSGPIVRDRTDGLLAAYLAMTPRTLAVPQGLLTELTTGTPTPPELANRTVVPGPVHADDLAVPPGTPLASQSCYSTYYADWDWHDAATPGMPAIAYTAGMFGGKRRYTDSYVANCTYGSDYLWARHRIYYMKSNGDYKKQYESKVKPRHWEAESKGSIKRWRKVIYDDGWAADPHCGDLTGQHCMYTREGKFDD
jgi:hypothetical protein